MKSRNLLLTICLAGFLWQCTFDSLHENKVFAGDLPRAEFNLPNNNKACARDCEIQFTNSSDNAVAYEWDFGDGNMSMEENPVHTYSNPGTYTVTLKAINQNATDEFTQELNIEQAVSFVKTFGGDNYDEGQKAFQLQDNTYVMLGYVESKDIPSVNQNTDYQIYYVHTDENGQLLDQKGFGTAEGGCGLEGGAAINFGDIVIAAHDDEPWMFRIDPTGSSFDWEKRNPVDIRAWESLIAHPNGGVFAAGKAENLSTLTIAKVAIHDGKITTKNFSNLSGSHVRLSVAKDGSLLVVAHKGSFNGDLDPILMNLDLDLNVNWTKENFGGSSVDLIYSAAVDSEGNIFMTGYSSSFTNGSNDILVIKTDANGNLIDHYNYGTAKSELARDIILNDEDEPVIVGRAFNGDSNSNDAYFLKLNTDMEIKSDWYFGGDKTDSFNAISLLTDGGYVITGVSNGTTGTQDALLIKTDSEGRIAE